MQLKRDKSGFTLLEVIVALAIFTIGILALYTAQTATIGYNSGASRMTTAVNWAAQTLEAIVSLDYRDLTDQNGDKTSGLSVTSTTGADYSAVSPDGRYTIVWNVVEDMPMPNVKTVRVYVLSGGRGMGRNVHFEFLKHENI